ncbi:unnamed protein product [Victoria cruziana]
MIRTNSSRPHMDELTVIAGQAPVEPKRRMVQVEGIKKNDCRRRKWVETLGIGKEMMHMMAIVRSLRLDFRCFGAVQAPSFSSSEGEEEDAELEDVEGDHCKGSDAGIEGNRIDGENEERRMANESEDQERQVPSLSPDAHAIKRCVSAPAKGWRSRGDDREKEEEERKAGGEDRVLGAHKLQRGDQEQSERLILKSYAPDFFRVSPDIANRAWNKKSACSLLHRSRSLMR